MDEIKAIEEKATEIADNILKAIEPFLSEIKKKNEKIKELEKDVKMYFDSCRLREESLFSEVERREKAEARVKELEAELAKIKLDSIDWKEWIDKRPRSQVYEE